MIRILKYAWTALLLTCAVLATGCVDKERQAVDEALHLADKAMADRDWNQAITGYTKGLELRPNDETLLYGRAAAYLAKARNSYNLASAAATRSDMDAAKAEAHNADTSFENAKKDCLEIIGKNAKNADAWYVKGCVELYLGAWNSAIESFSTCIRENPQSPFAWQRRGEVYAHIGDNANSIIDFKKAAELGYVGTSTKKGTDR